MATVAKRPRVHAFSADFLRDVRLLCEGDVKGEAAYKVITGSHPRVQINKEKISRNIVVDYNCFAVTYDLGLDAGPKGTMIFPSFDAFFDYRETLAQGAENFYHRAGPGCIPLFFDIDELKIGQDFSTPQQVVRALLEELNQFIGDCDEVLSEHLIEEGDMVVLQCPKRDKGGAELFSLHIHSKEHFFTKSEEQQQFMKAFKGYCKVDLGIDLSVYGKCRSLRLPFSCKRVRAGAEKRILKRVDRVDASAEDRRETLKSALLLKDPDTLNESCRIQTRFRTRPPVMRSDASGRLDLNENATAGPYDRAIMERTLELLEYRFQEPAASFKLQQGNEHRLIWEYRKPFYCDACGREHENNTNFRTKVAKALTPPQIVVCCFQSHAHTQQSLYSKVLGPVSHGVEEFSFCMETCVASIDESKEELAQLKDLKCDLKAANANLKHARVQEARAHNPITRAHWESKQTEAEERIAEIEADIAAPQAAVDDKKEQVLAYVARFIKLIDQGPGGGKVLRLRMCRDDTSNDEDTIVGVETLDTLKNFMRCYAHTTWRRCTFDPDDETQNVFELWLDWKGRKTYTGTGFYPTGSPLLKRNPDHFNTFKGLAFTYSPTHLTDKYPNTAHEDIPAKAFPNTMQVIRDRTEFGLDGDENRQTEFLCYWIRCLLVCPGQPVPIIQILYGGMGTGKSLIARMVKLLVGAINTKEVTGLNDLFHKFNAHLVGKLFFVVSEMGALDERTHKNPDQDAEHNLKDMLDACGGKKNVTRKGFDSIEVDLCMWTMGCTNNKECVEVDEKERRKNCINGTRHETREHRTYTGMVDEIETRETLKDIFCWFYEYPCPRGSGSAGNAYFRDPLNLPQTPYVKWLKSLQTGIQNEAFIKLFFEPLTKAERSFAEESVDVTLFDKPLATADDGFANLQVIAEADIVGPQGETYYFCPAVGGKPSFIRVPSKWFWTHVLMQHGNQTSQPKRALKDLVGSAISREYRDWYDRLATSHNYKINGVQTGCFVLPYGPGGCELKRIVEKLVL